MVADSLFRRLCLVICLVMVAGLGAGLFAVGSTRVGADSAPWSGLVTTEGRSLVRHRLPRPFALDLRQPPLGWTGVHTFQVVLQLAPVSPKDGYSAAYGFVRKQVRTLCACCAAKAWELFLDNSYELDWLALKCASAYLPLVLKGF